MEIFNSEDDSVLLCPLCARKHRLRKTEKEVLFFNCPSMSYSTNVFFRTPQSFVRLETWRRNARIYRPSKARREVATQNARRMVSGTILRELEKWKEDRRKR